MVLRNFTHGDVMQAHTAPIRSMTYTHSDKWILSSDDSGLVRLWTPRLELAQVGLVLLFHCRLQPDALHTKSYLLRFLTWLHWCDQKVFLLLDIGVVSGIHVSFIQRKLHSRKLVQYLRLCNAGHLPPQ